MYMSMETNVKRMRKRDVATRLKYRRNALRKTHVMWQRGLRLSKCKHLLSLLAI